MGANIGTTITGQLIALDVGQLAPLFAFCGVALIVFVKKQKVHHYGLIVAGLVHWNGNDERRYDASA